MLVTCTRGEMGEIVIPDMDTPDNHRRLGELRAVELERAMGTLGVTEWENLGYRDSDMMGRAGNLDPRRFWQADLDEAIGRLGLARPAYQPDVMTTYNDFGGYGHPDHIRTHDVAVGAFERAGDPRGTRGSSRRSMAGAGPPVDDGGLAPWAPSKLYEQAIPASVRTAMSERHGGERRAARSGRRPRTPRRSSWPSSRRFFGKMLVPDEAITTLGRRPGPGRAKWQAMHEHVTQISDDKPFMALRHGRLAAVVVGRALRAAGRAACRPSRPETDLFAGLA